MSRKALLLFAATSVIWGSSFLFIRVTVAHLPPSAVVFGRTVRGAVFLVPLAASSRAFRGTRPVIVPIAVVTLLDMAALAFLTAWGEQHISSSAAGILTATDPLFTAVLALWLIRSEAPGRKQLAGLITGFAGVIALLGLDFRGNTVGNHEAQSPPGTRAVAGQSQRNPPPHPMQRSIVASMVSRLTRRMRAELVSAGNTHDRRAFRSPTAR
jgi:drug/metabolite transporter (DMT)-like permease